MLPPYDDLTAKYIHTKYLQKERVGKARPDFGTATKSQTQIQGVVSYNTQGPSRVPGDFKDSANALPVKSKAPTYETVRNITKTIPREPKLDLKKDLKPQKSEIGTRSKETQASTTPPKRTDPTQVLQSSSQHIANPKETSKTSNPRNVDKSKKSLIAESITYEAEETSRKNSKSRVFTGFTGSEIKIQAEIESFRNDLEELSRPQPKVDELMQAKLEKLKKKPQSQMTSMEREMLKLLGKKK